MEVSLRDELPGELSRLREIQTVKREDPKIFGRVIE
jgi:hypothetical protein